MAVGTTHSWTKERKVASGLLEILVSVVGKANGC